MFEFYKLIQRPEADKGSINYVFAHLVCGTIRFSYLQSDNSRLVGCFQGCPLPGALCASRMSTDLPIFSNWVTNCSNFFTYFIILVEPLYFFVYKAVGAVILVAAQLHAYLVSQCLGIFIRPSKNLSEHENHYRQGMSYRC